MSKTRASRYRPVFLAIFLIASAVGSAAEQYYVCSSGTMEDGTACNFQTLQSAIDSVPNGSTIVMRSGDTTDKILIRGGKQDLTIKASQIDSYPRGYRISRNNPSLAKIVSRDGSPPVTIGEEFQFGVPQVGTNQIKFNKAHGFAVGDKVSLSGALFSPYYCGVPDAPPFGSAQCPASRVGYFLIRGNSWIRNGTVVYVRGPQIPAPLQPDRPYYAINVVNGGSGANPDRFQLAASPDGPPVMPGPDYVYNSGLTFEVPAAPARIYDDLYVSSVPDRTSVTLSRQPDGEPLGPWLQTSSGYDGGSVRAGLQIIRVNPVRNITFDGMEITHNPDLDPWILFHIRGEWTDPEGETSGIRILRCWIHGDDDQESLPHQGVYLSARNSEVGWSIIENLWSNFADTQAIAMPNTSGGINIHDNFLSATGEIIMSGGTFPSRLGTQAVDIRVRRNYLYKPLNWWTGIGAAFVNPKTASLVPRMYGTSCKTQASSANLSNKCFWYEGTTRYEMDDDVQFNIEGAAGSGRIVIYGQDGRIRLRHNLEGDITCPSSIDCARAEHPSFPPGSARITLIPITKGAIPSSLWVDNRPPWVKNAIESKTGDHWVIEGNVLHRQYLYPGGISQDMLINITNAVNGSSDLQPVNYLVSSSDIAIRNNIFRHAGKGIIGIGRSYTVSGPTARWEAAGLGKADHVRVENNLFVDIGSSEWTQTTRGPVFQNQNNSDWSWVHNTAVDVRHSVQANAPNSRMDFSANIFIPYLAGNPAQSTPSHAGVVADGAVSWIQLLKLRSGPLFDSESRFGRNLLMNRNSVKAYTTRGVDYPGAPDTTYLIEANDPDRDPATLFMRWFERSGGAKDASGSNYRSSEYRVRPEQAAKYPTYTGRTIGADMDELEALTGRYGKDVEEGAPEFAVRSERKIEPGTTTAVISYLPAASPCSLKVWDNDAYSGAAVVDITDEGGVLNAGRKYVSLPLLKNNTAYFGKRWCGAETDVFRFSTLSNYTAVTP